MAESFAAQLRGARRARALTMSALARQAGVSYHAVLSYERGIRSPAEPAIVRRLAQALGADPAPLLTAAGFSPAGRVPYETATTMSALLEECEAWPWPCLMNNENIEVVAGNRAAALLAGMPLGVPVEPGDRHLLRLAISNRFAGGLTNLDDVLSRLAGTLKSDGVDVRGPAQGPRFFAALVSWIAGLDPPRRDWLFGLWASASPWPVARRMSFSAEWRCNDGAELSFDCIVTPWSMLVGAWAFDWFPADARTWAWFEARRDVAVPVTVWPATGTMIEERRRAYGLTRPALAALAGVSEATVYQWERGLRRPGPRRLAELVRQLVMDGTTAGLLTDALGYDPIPSAAERYLLGETIPGRPDLATIEIAEFDDDEARGWIEAHPWPSLVLDGAGSVRAWNTLAARLFGRPTAPPLGSVSALVASEQFLECCSNWDECAATLVAHPVRLTAYARKGDTTALAQFSEACTDRGLIERFARSLALERRPAGTRAYFPFGWRRGAERLAFHCVVSTWNPFDPYVAVDFHPADGVTSNWARDSPV